MQEDGALGQDPLGQSGDARSNLGGKTGDVRQIPSAIPVSRCVSSFGDETFSRVYNVKPRKFIFDMDQPRIPLESIQVNVGIIFFLFR